MGCWQHYFLSVKSRKTPFFFLKFLTDEITEIEHDIANFIAQLKSSIIHDSFIQDSIKNILLPKLGGCLELVLSLEFNAAKKSGFLASGNNACILDYFVEILIRDKNSFYEKYPVLKVAINNIFIEFRELIYQLIRHSHKDYCSLTSFFFKDESFQLVSANATGDQHENGLRVVALKWCNQFNETKSIIYKPRSAKTNLIWARILDFVNKKTSLSLRNFQILPREHYFWAEYLEHKACEDDELPIFYQKLGGLLALTYIFSGNDIHAENLIACGVDPVIIDLETIFQPLILPNDKKDTIPTPLNILSQFFLPNRICNIDTKKSFDVSAVRNVEGQHRIVDTLKINKVNGIEEIDFSFESTELSQLSNIPSARDPLDYQMDFANGFETIYRLCMNNIEEIKTCINDLDLARIRLIIRPTHQYEILLGMLKHPKILSSIETKRNFISNKLLDYKLNVESAIINSELSALNTGCIPSFWFDNENTKVLDGANRALDLFVYRTSYQQVDYMLSQLSEEDLFLQKFLIYSSYDAARKTDVILGFKKQNKKSGDYNEKMLSDGKLLYENKVNTFPALHSPDYINNHYCNDLMITLEMLEFKVEKAVVGWPSNVCFPDGSLTPCISNIDLKDGILGFALVYAHLGEQLNDAYYTQKSKYCLQRFWRIFNKPSSLLLKQSQQSGFYGYLGGGVLVLARLADLWSTHEFNEWIDVLLQQGMLLCDSPSIEHSNENEQTSLLLKLNWISECFGYLQALIKSQPLLPDSLLNKSDLQTLFYKITEQLPATIPSCLFQVENRQDLVDNFYRLSNILSILHLAIFEAGCPKIPLYEELMLQLCHESESSFVFSEIRSKYHLFYSHVLVLLRMSCHFLALRPIAAQYLNDILSEIEDCLSEGEPSLQNGNNELLELILTGKQLGYIDTDHYERLVLKVIQSNHKNLYAGSQCFSTGLLTGYAGLLYQALRLKNPDKLCSLY